MREQLKTRFAVPEDNAKILEWLEATPGNDFDKGILKYPTLQIMCSYNSEPKAFLPTHRAMILESTAINPAATEQEKAQALRDLVKAATLVASSHQIKELYFIVSDERLAEVARHHGFEDKKCLRLKL